MKVEAVVLKPMRAGDGKQGIKFASVTLSTQNGRHLVRLCTH